MMRSGHHFLRPKHGLAQRVVKAGLPAWTGGTEVLRDVGIQPDGHPVFGCCLLLATRADVLLYDVGDHFNGGTGAVEPFVV